MLLNKPVEQVPNCWAPVDHTSISRYQEKIRGEKWQSACSMKRRVNFFEEKLMTMMASNQQLMKICDTRRLLTFCLTDKINNYLRTVPVKLHSLFIILCSLKITNSRKQYYIPCKTWKPCNMLKHEKGNTQEFQINSNLSANISGHEHLTKAEQVPHNKWHLSWISNLTLMAKIL